jgi:hypothetical protein
LNIIITNIKWTMVIAGLLTSSMIFAVFAPQTALINMFCEALTEPLAQVVVRSWEFLIFLMGVLLIFGAQYIETSAVTLILNAIIVISFAYYLVKMKGVI